MASPQLKSNNLYILDKSFYPDFWQDDVRMDALFSPFRIKSLNPENYESKLKFWKDIITQYCLATGCSEISINELKNGFKRKGKVPYSLTTVFEDMEINKEIQLRSIFMEPPQHSWTGWAVNTLMKKPLSWGFNKVKEQIVQTKDDNDKRYVVLSAIQSQSQQLLKQTQHLSETVLSMEELLSKSSEMGLSTDGIILAIQSLDREQKLYIDRTISSEDNSKILVKFAAINQKVSPINELERSIYNLEKTEKSLLKVIEKFEQEIKDVDAQTRLHIKEKRRQLAKNYLKKRHILEKSLEKRFNTLEQIQTLLTRIHDSKSDNHIIEAYKLGSNTLKNVLLDSGITLDSVDDTLAEVQEVLEMHDEIQTTIGTAQITTNTEEDLILEKELADLLDDELDVEQQPVQPPSKEKNRNEDNIPDMDTLERRLQALKTSFGTIPSTDDDKEKTTTVKNTTLL